jgi:acyl-CoA reductase-like NAD-dependent aldehyde dehydrogenase
MLGLGKREIRKDSSGVNSFPMIIDGKPVYSETMTEVINPATEDVVGLAPVSSLTQLNDAVAAARHALPAWRAQSDDARKDACRRVAKAIEASATELSRLLTMEQGKPLKGLGSEFELGGCAAWMGAVADFALPMKVLQDDHAARIEQHREPVGVVGSITPWNWPVMIAIWHIASAIRTGNTVVVKPAEFTPLSTLRMIDVMNRELPPGVLNVVAGGGDIGAALAAHHDVNKIIFTGSTRTGKLIMKSAAENLKRLTLELGGNDAGIVLPGTDIARKVESLFWGAFINGGQTCAALKRLYVHESQYDEMCRLLTELAASIPMGNGLDENNLLGPLQNRNQFNKVAELVSDARKNGARILTGGKPLKGAGYFYPATIIADAKDGMRIVDEEQFGPALPVIRYKNIADAIESANKLDYGLAASVWSDDIAEAQTVATRIEAGTVYINNHGSIAPHVPFGGVKGSGVGVEFGVEGLEACTNIKIYNIAK